MNIQRNILQAVKGKLEQISGMSGCVFIQQAPQGTQKPSGAYIVLSIIEDTPKIYFGSGNASELTYADVNASIFDLKVNGPQKVEDVANSGYYLFHNQSITVSGYDGAFTRIIQRPIFMDGGVSKQDAIYFQCIQPIRFQGARSQ